MISINYKNLGIELDLEKLAPVLERIKKQPTPAFEAIKTDLGSIEKKSQNYKQYENVILIGNGGSRTSSWAFYNSLFSFRNDVHFEFLPSAEPELINSLKEKYPRENTLVLVISKSGTNINNIEPLLSFLGYPVLVISENKNNLLSNIAKIRNWEKIAHPAVGGRYAGMTSCGLVPAYLMGLDIKEIYAGAESGYKKYNCQVEIEKNDALKMAAYFHKLEESGYTEIFSSIYSSALFGFFPLIVQLIHENTGKNGQGQTIFGDYSPESQHHTNQRLFGGRKNVVALLMEVKKSLQDFPIEVPEDIKNEELSGVTLENINGIPAHKTLSFDMQGVWGHCIEKNIPVAVLTVNEINEKTMGEFMVFWQYFTMYSSLLRNQNPFDQPEVERSKNISFQLRFQK
ncbi:MAG: hypothetical protein ACD_11C00004G0047 [uncultured bacterium]|nr:MAG: hypothetical protein ACD_11C00004G0047 [uncultured bacterium]HBR71715.1 hypothetical protein [Candidatus Moranbacteria bacterium]